MSGNDLGYTLTIIDSEGGIRESELNFSRKTQITMGRDAVSNDIALPYEFVSGRHGKITIIEGRAYYEDLRSSNGTIVETSGVQKYVRNTEKKEELQNGSIIRIGLPNQIGTILLLFSRLQQKEAWKKIPLGKKPVTIGRSSKNDIILKNSGVSRFHAEVEESKGKYIIRDLKSANGILINGIAVNSEAQLKIQDVIQILDYQLIFSRNMLFYKTVARGISLDIRNIHKTVMEKNEKKVLLNHVNCEIGSNEFVAIVGGSGAGKTTLMNAVSGFDKEVEGAVFCNGINLHKNFQHLKSIIGYVPQQDIIYENLTLRKMLYYTAKLKMPDDTSGQEIEDKINEVLEMVELTEHQNKYIRKFSGGQKKRASIAVELLADPKLFFLDEPTSGLDPGTEKNLMTTLSKLSKTKDKTIIMVTHTTQSLDMCDKIIFMGPGGRLCFCGKAEQALMFFDTDNLVDIYNIIAENPVLWEEQFANCMNNQDKPIPTSQGEQAAKKKNSALRQFFYLSVRYMELIKNDVMRLMMLFLQPLIVGVLLYLVADEDIFDIYEPTKSMLFALSCSGIWIGLFNSIQEICKERVIIKREYMANLKLPIYILSKFIVQAVIGFVQAVLLTGVFLLAVGKSKEGIFFSNFYFEMLLTVFLTILASMSMGFIISSLVKTGDKAMAAAPFILIVQLLFSGILFTLSGAGEWISYLTISRWSVEGLGSIANLNDMQLRMQEQMPALEHEFEEFFECAAQHLWQVWGILLGMAVIFSILSVVCLRRVAKDRR